MSKDRLAREKSPLLIWGRSVFHCSYFKATLRMHVYCLTFIDSFPQLQCVLFFPNVLVFRHTAFVFVSLTRREKKSFNFFVCEGEPCVSRLEISCALQLL